MGDSQVNVVQMPGEYVPITFGKKTYRLRYNFKAFMAIEKQTGRPVSQLGNFATMSAKDLRSIVAAGISRTDGTRLTAFEVGSLLWLGNMGQVLRKVTEAITKSIVTKGPAEQSAAPLDPTKK